MENIWFGRSQQHCGWDQLCWYVCAWLSLGVVCVCAWHGWWGAGVSLLVWGTLIRLHFLVIRLTATTLGRGAGAHACKVQTNLYTKYTRTKFVHARPVLEAAFILILLWDSLGQMDEQWESGLPSVQEQRHTGINTHILYRKDHRLSHKVAHRRRLAKMLNETTSSHNLAHTTH